MSDINWKTMGWIVGTWIRPARIGGKVCRLSSFVKGWVVPLIVGPI
ncbi:hypothetical protein THTE_1383 [Thermogutta terrifontis]|uniref:Uncharacterized protein n=1 Tax=Thermogutta terrifontis TaxID=1331910 RepID=A0A286RDE1_9BACT|nr:hypothetical protein THTE_1383 [Thermogutta terrifontis]